MKLRRGFVSNSSTSSFLLMTTKTRHEKICAGLHPFVLAAVESAISEGIFCGQKVVWMQDLRTPDGYSYLDGCIGDESDFEFDGEIPKGRWDENMSPSEAVDIWQDAVKGETEKDVDGKIISRGDVFETSMDM